jgi:two-component system, OmpR family, osmolarity sensor histidine kinase EnvZ
VIDMEQMIEGYLAFARGEGAEAPVPTDLNRLINEAVSSARRDGAIVDLHLEGELSLPLRPNSVKRCLANLIGNARRYADHVWVQAGRRDDAIEITVDDDGPGIPASSHEDVFRPFFRLEGSRNRSTGGVGLGLTIARDVIRSHGGDITLSDSPRGGLRAVVRLPV